MAHTAPGESLSPLLDSLWPGASPLSAGGQWGCGQGKGPLGRDRGGGRQSSLPSCPDPGWSQASEGSALPTPCLPWMVLPLTMPPGSCQAPASLCLTSCTASTCDLMEVTSLPCPLPPPPHRNQPRNRRWFCYKRWPWKEQHIHSTKKNTLMKNSGFYDN